MSNLKFVIAMFTKGIELRDIGQKVLWAGADRGWVVEALEVQRRVARFVPPSTWLTLMGRFFSLQPRRKQLSPHSKVFCSFVILWRRKPACRHCGSCRTTIRSTNLPFPLGLGSATEAHCAARLIRITDEQHSRGASYRIKYDLCAVALTSKYETN